MADPNAASQGAAKAAGASSSQGNPVFRMMGPSQLCSLSQLSVTYQLLDSQACRTSA